MLAIGEGFLWQVLPRLSGMRGERQSRIVSAVAPVLADTLSAYAIDTGLRIAHFTAQAAHESAAFATTEEFASGAAYEGRLDLGNLRAGDGVRFKGRGLLQLTGRANYRRIGEKLGLPLEEEPALAAEPAVSLKIACEYWRDRAINEPADADDLATVTRCVNGGLNGIKERHLYLDRAKAALLPLDGQASSAPAPPTLRFGASGEAVGKLQALLREQGYPLALDRRFGPATERAVRRFQPKAGLVPDGIVGRKTWAALTR